MELVRGKTLTELLSRHGMPLSKFFEIAIPLADAVAAAHGVDITHRDLKPDNVMLGDDGRIKVLISGWLSRCRGLWMSAARFRRRRRLGKGLLLGRLLICLRSRRKGRRLTRGRIFFRSGLFFTRCCRGGGHLSGIRRGRFWLRLLGIRRGCLGRLFLRFRGSLGGLLIGGALRKIKSAGISRLLIFVIISRRLGTMWPRGRCLRGLP